MNTNNKHQQEQKKRQQPNKSHFRPNVSYNLTDAPHRLNEINEKCSWNGNDELKKTTAAKMNEKANEDYRVRKKYAMLVQFLFFIRNTSTPDFTWHKANVYDN